MRKPLSNKKRFDIFMRDRWTCQYCGAGREAKLEIDHIEAYSKGGQCTPENFVTACRECNRGKHAHDVLPVEQTYETLSEELGKWDRCIVCKRATPPDEAKVDDILTWIDINICDDSFMTAFCIPCLRNAIDEAIDMRLSHSVYEKQGFIREIAELKGEQGV